MSLTGEISCDLTASDIVSPKEEEEKIFLLKLHNIVNPDPAMPGGQRRVLIKHNYTSFSQFVKEGFYDKAAYSGI
jgi:hypothetical protein